MGARALWTRRGPRPAARSHGAFTIVGVGRLTPRAAEPDRGQAGPGGRPGRVVPPPGRPGPAGREAAPPSTARHRAGRSARRSSCGRRYGAHPGTQTFSHRCARGRRPTGRSGELVGLDPGDERPATARGEQECASRGDSCRPVRPPCQGAWRRPHTHRPSRSGCWSAGGRGRIRGREPSRGTLPLLDAWEHAYARRRVASSECAGGGERTPSSLRSRPAKGRSPW